MQVIHFDQDMQVCGIFHIVLILNIFVLLCIMNLSFWMSASWKYGISLFLSSLFLFFSSCSLACIFFSHAFWHGYVFFFFSLFFSIAHTILFGIWKFLRERHMITEWSNYLVDGKSMFVRNSQCKSQQFSCGCTWVLVMGAWRESRLGSQ